MVNLFWFNQKHLLEGFPSSEDWPGSAGNPKYGVGLLQQAKSIGLQMGLSDHISKSVMLSLFSNLASLAIFLMQVHLFSMKCTLSRPARMCYALQPGVCFQDLRHIWFLTERGTLAASNLNRRAVYAYKCSTYDRRMH